MQTKAPTPTPHQGLGEQGEWRATIEHYGYRVSISDDEQILEMDIDDGYVTLWMHLDATELCI